MSSERIRLPVWTDGATRKPFVVLVSELADDWASVRLFGDAEIRHMRMAASDYLALPYHYLEILGPAPRPVPVHPYEPGIT